LKVAAISAILDLLWVVFNVQNQLTLNWHILGQMSMMSQNFSLTAPTFAILGQKA
jgi:hypothetical protein